MIKKCPRCKVNDLDEKQSRNSLSRKDNKTMICNDCGTAEAMEELHKANNARNK